MQCTCRKWNTCCPLFLLITGTIKSVNFLLVAVGISIITCHNSWICFKDKRVYFRCVLKLYKFWLMCVTNWGHEEYAILAAGRYNLTMILLQLLFMIFLNIISWKWKHGSFFNSGCNFTFRNILIWNFYLIGSKIFFWLTDLH